MKLPYKKLTVNEIDDIADDTNISLAINSSNCLSYRIYKIINSEYDKENEFEFIGIYLDLTEFFLKQDDAIYNYFKNKNMYIYDKKNKEKNMFSYLENIFLKKKKVFISVDIYGYGNTETEESEYDTHTCILIFIPVENDCYKFVFINPHARDITFNYTVVYSSTRVKNIFYKEGIDVIYMTKFIGSLNKYLKKRTNINILFDKSNACFYRGINLQSGDSRGYCYLFPFVIFHYFRFYYNKSREVEGIYFKDMETLIKEGELNELILNCLVDFCVPIKEKLKEITLNDIDKYYDDFEDILYRQDFRLFKKMAAVHLVRIVNIFWGLFS